MSAFCTLEGFTPLLLSDWGAEIVEHPHAMRAWGVGTEPGVPGA